MGTVIRQAFPDLELHASTQMAVTGADGAAFLQGNGYVRVVPAREISLPEIRKIKEKRAFLWSVSFTGPSVTVIPDSVF